MLKSRYRSHISTGASRLEEALQSRGSQAEPLLMPCAETRIHNHMQVQDFEAHTSRPRMRIMYCVTGLLRTPSTAEAFR